MPIAALNQPHNMVRHRHQNQQADHAMPPQAVQQGAWGAATRAFNWIKNNPGAAIVSTLTVASLGSGVTIGAALGKANMHSTLPNTERLNHLTLLLPGNNEGHRHQFTFDPSKLAIAVTDFNEAHKKENTTNLSDDRRVAVRAQPQQNAARTPFASDVMSVSHAAVQFKRNFSQSYPEYAHLRSPKAILTALENKNISRYDVLNHLSNNTRLA